MRDEQIKILLALLNTLYEDYQKFISNELEVINNSGTYRFDKYRLRRRF